MENNIQNYRKRLGLSQEELGERLFVSRQTISQWETGQTQPTLDNLMRLHEILGVSIDELVGVAVTKVESEPKAQPNAPAAEQHIVEYSQSEVYEICNIGLKKSIRNLVISALASLLLLILACTVEDGALFAVLFGVFLMCTALWINYLIKHRRTTMRAAQRMVGKKYCFTLIGPRLILSILDDSGVVFDRVIMMHEIDWVRETKTFAVFEHDGLIYALRRSQMPEFAVTYAALKGQENYKPLPKSPKLRGWGIAFFVLTLLSIIFGLWISVLLGMALPLKDGSPAFPHRFWGFFLVLPIPIFSIVLGYMLKKREMPHRKNFVASGIIIPLLIIYGCFCFMPLYEINPIANIEEQLDIDIPQYTYYRSTNTFDRFTCTITFARDEAELFEAQIDGRWLDKMSEELEEFYPLKEDEISYEKVLLYNSDTSEYNTPPDEKNDYALIILYYDSQYSRLTIVQYQTNAQ